MKEKGYSIKSTSCRLYYILSLRNDKRQSWPQLCLNSECKRVSRTKKKKILILWVFLTDAQNDSTIAALLIKPNHSSNLRPMCCLSVIYHHQSREKNFETLNHMLCLVGECLLISGFLFCSSALTASFIFSAYLALCYQAGF